MLDELGVPYALGGSLAATFFGEPRSTMDIDIAIAVTRESGEALLERAGQDFYVPTTSARAAVADKGSFNLLEREGGMKVDLFVLGDNLLDKRQIERRLQVPLPGSAKMIWVTSPEDQVLRKLSWFRSAGSISDRQWRDVLGLVRGSGALMNWTDLREAAGGLGLSDLLESAVSEA